MEVPSQHVWFYIGRQGASSLTAGHVRDRTHFARPPRPEEAIEPTHRTVVQLDHDASTHTSPPPHPETPLSALTLPIAATTIACCVALRLKARRAPPARR